MVQKYKEMPIIIEAFELKTKDNISEKEIFHNAVCWIKQNPLVAHTAFYNQKGVYIVTPERTMLAKLGDFIVKSQYKKFYPCKPDIFHKTYEKVET